MANSVDANAAPEVITIDPRIARIDWIAVAAAALVCFWILALTTSFGRPQGWATDTRGVAIQGDFIGVYTAGQMVRSGHPAMAYDWDRHMQAQQQLTVDAKAKFFPWPYPPTFLLIAGMLALLPYGAAMMTWAFATLAGFAAALWKITGNTRHTLLLMAMPAAWLNLTVGQNGTATAALIGFALALLPTQPVLAGVCVGLMSIKPHLGLLPPIALVAGWYWRSFVSAGMTVVAMVAFSILAFGIEPWLAMPEQLARVMAIVKNPDAPQKLQSVFGIACGLGLPASLGMAAQTLTLLLLVGAVGWTWRRADVPYDLKAALLATAMTLASPYQFVYDLTILTVAQAFLIRHLANSHRITAVEIGALIGANILIFKFADAAIPLGVFGCIIVLGLTGYHIAVALGGGRSLHSPADSLGSSPA
jgi:arabinofuranan 3-O-arabinosyltransferase